MALERLERFVLKHHDTMDKHSASNAIDLLKRRLREDDAMLDVIDAFDDLTEYRRMYAKSARRTRHLIGLMESVR